MCDHILSNSFWDDAEAIKQVVSPLYFILRLSDHEGATMSLVYHYMQRLDTCMTKCNALSRERLSTSQLDKLVYVNANLRLLERLRLRDGNGEGVLQWKVKDIDASVIANLERGLALGEAIDITFIQQRSDEDLAYDFFREEHTRFMRVT
ncbi:hypothetical protein L7F22_045670 [Adiantum nelumboides]|nr:hypothetical protein [Adiantum nelumboides]